MKKINIKILDLNEVYVKMSYAETSNKLNILKSLMNSIVLLKDEMIHFNENTNNDSFIDEISTLTNQLNSLNKNIRTLENVLLIHESKVLEKRPSLVDLSIFCLN